ncbi:N-6 DNA methylase [soil metagenome]|nr:SAM-dependent DNA methyltransferase [Gemmatimonadota bacterium]
MHDLIATLTEYGADPKALRRFDDEESGPDLLPYATLVSAREAGDHRMGALFGVYEWQNSPLIFLVDGEDIRSDNDLRVIRRRLAMRGDAPYLGVVRPGTLAVYQISLDARAPSKASVPDLPASHTFAYLANERPGASTNRRRWISEVVLRLLSESISELMNAAGVMGDEAISLVGRALFTRFLGDRDLLPPSLIPEGRAEAARLFDTAERAEATSQWLDNTFNGEFLPLSTGLFRTLPSKAFHALGNVMRRAEEGQLYLEWEEDWAHLDFAHIPVGVLSQAYELYLREHQKKRQQKEGGYYTPRAIAQLMVSAAFHALRRDGIAHEVRVLDPAAGAGVFLLTAFRQLVAERWRHDGERPDTKTLRKILYKQITGFDINESALRFAALGLYLLAIELDPNPEPVEKLHFDDLRKRSVLLKLGDEGSLGSLGDGVGDDHTGRYDLVIGNPPWASLTKLAGWSSVAERVKGIAEARVPGSDNARLLPNQPLDLPFVWCAMQWAKPGGQIVFALHARLLFQQHEGMPEARAALFKALDVTGVVNGAELRQTNVWPEVDAPFCLFFARNRASPPGASFSFVSPRLEDSLNQSGGVRIDTESADRVTAEQVAQRPEILKILFRGSRLDLEVFERGFIRDWPSLFEFWGGRFGISGGKLDCAGAGYQKLRPSSRIRKIGDGKPGVPVDYLFEALCERNSECTLPEITPEAMQSILVDRNHLRNFDQKRLHDPRDPSIFLGPLLLVHESPPARMRRVRVAVSDTDVVFNQSYHGYSANTHPRGRQLVRYLALLIGSRPAFWYYLMTSGRFGFEREVLEKATIDRIPILPFEELDTSALKEVEDLFDTVASQDNKESWGHVDAWVARLYSLRESDLQVIDDTLRLNLPFAANRKEAQKRPSREQVEAFCEALFTNLHPWAKKAERAIQVLRHPLQHSSPWQLVRVQIGRVSASDTTAASDWLAALRLADQLAASEVLYPDEQAGCLWVARLAQARYWSLSQARLLARRIVWEHADFLLGAERV